MVPDHHLCEALSRELASWISRNRLWTDTTLRQIDEYRGESSDGEYFRRFLSIRSEGDLSSIIDGYEIEEPGRAMQLRAEFMAIIDRHGFYCERHDNVLSCLYYKGDV